MTKFFVVAILFNGFLLFSSVAALSAAGVFDSLETIAPHDIFAIPEPAAPAPFPGPLKPAPALKTYFIDVGQGDAEYIELPNGKNALIDAGPFPTAPLIEFLTQHNVTKIDYAVMTHPHLDHYAGFDYVFTNLKVGAFYDTRMDNAGSSSDNVLRAKISALGIKTVYPAAGDELDWDPGEVVVKVLNSCPTPGASNSGPAINDCSIVLKVTYNNSSILYTGDIQADAEASLVSAYGDQLQADVLKVGHHGSNTSTSVPFLNMVKPKIAYIEVGVDNNFGFPALITLSNLQAVGAAVYRTDLKSEYIIRGK